MSAFSYPAAFRRDEDGRPVVSFPDFPHAYTDGKDMREAMEEAIDCLGSVIARAIAERLDIPAPSVPKRGQRLVPVPLWIAGGTVGASRLKLYGDNDLRPLPSQRRDRLA